ncbi:MAG TPA: OmcA/MtrC family decaheme c-type cytochrome [Ramlibacter sp.]|nr:OmcA/MtrC family decaheme c-type cytochrome [Ramlibacter sp.]
MRKNRWIGIGAASVLAVALAGCGGGGGTDTAVVTPPPGEVVTPPPAPAGVVSVTVAPPTGTPIDAAAMTPAEFAALAPRGAVTSVSIQSPPVVTFQLTDASNRGIKGLGSTSQAANAARPGLSNMAFALAKLVPGANGGASKWVSYIVTAAPTTTAGETPSRPTTDNIGTLVDNGDGTYKYTFYRDITKVKDLVAAASLAAPNVAADLGDLTYDPAKLHRLAIQVGGNARGTGTNTATGANSGITAVPMGAPVNILFDWYPASAKVVAATDPDQRELVSIDNCNECHGKLAFHGGNRVDTRYCVMCHTDQRRFGYANVASVAGKFPALKETATVNSVTGITSFSYSPETRVADGEVAGNFTTMVHKIHMGKELVKENYNYANVAFNNKGYSMLDGGQRMCSKCHDNTKAAQADNWKAKPTRMACGACHDGINWATGTGTTLADKAEGLGKTSGHWGKAQPDDSACALCHRPEMTIANHQTLNVTKHNPAVAAGLKNISYEIKSAAVDPATNKLSVVFRVLVDGTAATFKAPAAGMANPLDGFTGSPSFLLAYASDATATDGIRVPADYNNAGNKQAQAISVSIANLLDTGKAADGSLSARDANGYYTATLLGTGTKKFPVGATMRAVALQGYFTQVSPAAARHAISVVKEVTGDAVRRKVVDADKCANCHEWFEGHGGNRVYQTQVCVMCHVPGLASSGRQIPDSIMNTWSFTADLLKIVNFWGFDKTKPNAALALPVTTNNFKDMIHGIHAGRDRVNPFRDARDSTSRGAITLLDFARMDFPGQLSNCETCHIAGTYSGVPLNALPSTYETVDAAYDAAIAAGTATTALAKGALATTTANATDRVTTPFAGACVSCHDSAASKAHIRQQGGQLQAYRSASLAGSESCVTCHGAGRSEDPATAHRR